MADVKSAKKDWEETTVQPLISKRPERREFLTASGDQIDRLFVPEGEYPAYEDSLGFPGEYPYTRGVQPTMYRGRLWTMRQYAGFGSAEETNQRYRYLLSKGQSGLSVAFDLPTQMGYDSDHSLAEGEVGKTGVAIDHVGDMQTLFNEIPLDKVSTSMTINSPATILLAFYVAAAEQQGVDKGALRGTIQNDILKEYMARGTYIYPPEPSMHLVVDSFRFLSIEMPSWNAISISGYHIREAGCTAEQEIAFTLADGVAYVEAALSAGLAVDDFAPRLSFFFNAHNHLVEEVAKFRAARRLWARIMKERFGAKNPKSLMLRFHTQTAGSMLTAQQPMNNVVRVTLQALAAVLGGTQSLHTNSYDEALSLPTEQAVKMALRTQQIIAEETDCAASIDPLGGSWMVEQTTDRLEEAAQVYLKEIDDMGGMVSAIEDGYPQREIQDASYRWQMAVEAGREKIVGVNEYVDENEPPIETLRVDDSVRTVQMEKLAAWKSNRDQVKVDSHLDAIREAAEQRGHMFELFIAAAKDKVTEGEMTGVLREVFGTYRERVF